MNSHGHTRGVESQARAQRRHALPLHRVGTRWFAANMFLSGVLALLWLVFRSGSKPSRFAYPCQRAAMGTASLAFAAPLAAAVIAARARVALWKRMPAVAALAIVGFVATASVSIYLSRAEEYRGPVLAPPLAYRAQVYGVSGCPQNPTGQRFLGLDNLLGVMGGRGLAFYRAATVSPVAGPDGIIGAGDVVVVKINYQWDQRGGTDTDLLRGLIRRIVDHPDGFTGEVIVCENAQFNSVQNFDRSLNNAQDYGLSPRDVVLGFQAQGHTVSHFDWTAIRYASVNEFSTGDMANGYVIYPYDATLSGRVSYPKFRASSGTYVSLRFGIWNPANSSYDRERLKFINVPVLKSHHSTYGATVSVKNYMGVVTRELSTNSHSAIRYGILGAVLREIQLADLNIVDAIWINANPNSGPATSYGGATRRDQLLASVDPVALDMWCVRNVLIPAFLANGYLPPWPSPSADPDDPTSAFRQYLDNSMSRLLAAGYDVTNDLSQIDAWIGDGAAGDFDGDSDVDHDDFSSFHACFTGAGGGPVGPECAAGDFDGDGDIDCDDLRLFEFVWTSTAIPPAYAPCHPTGVPQADATTWSLSRAVPNPMGASTTFAYSIAAPGPVSIVIYDVAGRTVRTLVDASTGTGTGSVTWDGRDDRGRRVARGVYTCTLAAPGARASRKIVVE